MKLHENLRSRRSVRRQALPLAPAQAAMSRLPRMHRTVPVEPPVCFRHCRDTCWAGQHTLHTDRLVAVASESPLQDHSPREYQEQTVQARVPVRSGSGSGSGSGICSGSGSGRLRLRFGLRLDHGLRTDPGGLHGCGAGVPMQTALARRWLQKPPAYGGVRCPGGSRPLVQVLRARSLTDRASGCLKHLN